MGVRGECYLLSCTGVGKGCKLNDTVMRFGKEGKGEE